MSEIFSTSAVVEADTLVLCLSSMFLVDFSMQEAVRNVSGNSVVELLCFQFSYDISSVLCYFFYHVISK